MLHKIIQYLLNRFRKRKKYSLAIKDSIRAKEIR